MDLTLCEACGRDGQDIVGVAAVPGQPISIAWCRECLEHNVQPMFCVEVAVCDGGPPDGMASIKDTIARRGDVRPHLAEWFLESEVFHDGAYVTIGDYLGDMCAG